MGDSRSAARLLGRSTESAALDRLLAQLRIGQSFALVLHGEAGVGKTALLEHVVEKAVGCSVARAGGVESEMELAFAGLHQLCASMLDRLEQLPEPRRDALRVAFGLSAGSAPDRFLVGLATLDLLSEVATQRPLVCLIDDAHWLDRASAQALAIAARRLAGESVALVFAVRERSDDRELNGLPELAIEGIGDGDARRLLASSVGGRLDDAMLERIVAETRGNPLALLELPRGMTPAELAGGFGLPGARPLPGRIEQSFVRRLESLPSDTRRLLLVAAAEPVGDGSLLWRAAELLGLSTDAANAAEAAELIEFGARVRFRHPLVRSAVYRSASSVDRQDVHQALAEATDPETDPDRRAWHRARAARGPDEAIACELERSAARAQRRGGIAATAAFLERAAGLTPDPQRRGARALAAAQAKLEAAAPDAAADLLATAELGPLDELQRARVERLRAQIAFAGRRGKDAPPLLLAAARRLEPLDVALARETYLEALGAAIYAGRLADGCGVREVAEAARMAPPARQPLRAIDLLLDGLATWFIDGYVAALPLLERALLEFRRADHPVEEDTRWLWLACRVAPDLWDDAAWGELAERQDRLAHSAGALTVLPVAASGRAGVCVHAGEFAAASSLIDEADAIAEATGSARLRYTSLVLAAWRGEETPALELIESGIRDATVRGEGRVVALAEYATAVLYNGLGRYDAALAAAHRACEHDDLGLYAWAATELVEAAARSDQPDVAAVALEALAERTHASGTEWALGIEARSRALLLDGPAAEALYRESVERLARTRIAIHLARAQLLYGEWLRRENRRRDAREQLHRCHDMFRDVGATAFAERARRELTATGETVRKRGADTVGELTAQEARVAALAGAGHTNREIGTQLFISPQTVDSHLRKVFVKLGVKSRRELSDALRHAERSAARG